MSDGAHPVRALSAGPSVVMLTGVAIMVFGYAYGGDCNASTMNECRPFGLFVQEALGVTAVSGLSMFIGITAVVTGLVWKAVAFCLRLSRL